MPTYHSKSYHYHYSVTVLPVATSRRQDDTTRVVDKSVVESVEARVGLPLPTTLAMGIMKIGGEPGMDGTQFCSPSETWTSATNLGCQAFVVRILGGNTQFSWIKFGKFRQIAVFLHCFILYLLGFHAIPWYALLMVEENHLITNLLLGAVIHTPWTSVGGYGGILRHTYFNSQYGLNLEGAVPRVSKDWGI